MTLRELREQAGLEQSDIIKMTPGMIEIDRLHVVEIDPHDALVYEYLEYSPKDLVIHKHIDHLVVGHAILSYASLEYNKGINVPYGWLIDKNDVPQFDYQGFIELYPDYPDWLHLYWKHLNTIEKLGRRYTNSFKGPMTCRLRDVFDWYIKLVLDTMKMKEV